MLIASPRRAFGCILRYNTASLPAERRGDQFRVQVLGHLVHLTLGNVVNTTVRVVIHFPRLGGILTMKLDHHVIAFGNEAVSHQRERGCNLRKHWLKELVEDGLLAVERPGKFRGTDDGPADVISQTGEVGLGVPLQQLGKDVL
jgi:hypothetical protein